MKEKACVAGSRPEERSAMPEKEAKETKNIVTNSHPRDSSGKLIFEDATLCAQFCRDYVDLPYMKEVRPEDIEDVSSQFVPLIAEERNADRVKKIRVKGQNPFFLISLIEHKTKPEYNIGMQIFRYMVYIWEDYAKGEEKKHKGISKTRDFKYPMILPIVYYEGSEDNWTAPLHFREKIVFGELFGEYVPDFRYYLVPIRKFSNEELLEKGDEMSLLMLINKVQTKEDIEALWKIPAHKMQEILRDTPPHVLKIIEEVMFVLLLKENVPPQEAEELVEKVREKKMGELFENMEHMDIQAERRNTAEQRARAEKAESRAEKAEAQVEKEKMQGIQLFIETCREFGLSREEMLGRLAKQYEISLQLAEEWYEKAVGMSG